MKPVLYILLLSVGSTCFGQTKTERKRMEEFKNASLAKVGMYKPDTIYTSIGMLKRERLPDVRRISFFPKDKPVQYDEYYYNDTKVLESNHTYKLPGGELTGITKQYNRKGELEYIQDHDKGTWEVVRFEHYPYYGILKKMKGIVDSLIIAAYGQKFFNNYVIWYPESSVFYKSTHGGATWYDYQEWEPKSFLLRYSIKLSEEEMYDEQIEVQLDSTGQVIFPSDKYDNIKGFEKTAAKNGFVLTKALAIEKAKKLGLTENDSTKAFTSLTWQYHDEQRKEIFNGYFTYQVAINTKTITHPPTKGRNSIEYKFDVYVFNPWTGEFIEQKKMKSYREWEKLSGMSTGLLPDK